MLLAFTLRCLAVFLLLFLLPLATHAAWYAMRDDLAPDWARADWSSAKLLPRAAEHQPAMIRIYAARTGRWKSIVAHHSWVVVKEAGAARYTRFDKVGWGAPQDMQRIFNARRGRDRRRRRVEAVITSAPRYWAWCSVRRLKEDVARRRVVADPDVFAAT